jgi:hypothetical protein
MGLRSVYRSYSSIFRPDYSLLALQAQHWAFGVVSALPEGTSIRPYAKPFLFNLDSTYRSSGDNCLCGMAWIPVEKSAM